MGMGEPGPHPRRLGSFEVLQEIGQGGMGIVFLARQPSLERLAVLKRIRRELLEDARMLERFQREARAAAAVHHHNVVAVYDCFPFRGDHYIAQEFVDGKDLREVLDATGRLDVDVAALVGLEIIRGVEEIHSTGTIHRDLKPANILLGHDGAVKIVDFGIALDWRAEGLTRPGTMIGSIPYMSPEQMAGERVDYRSDLFSFGMVLYEMVVGAPAFVESPDDAPDVVLKRMKRAQFAPPRARVPAVPRYLSRLIVDCLRATPSKRPASASSVRRFLEHHLGTVSPPDSRAELVAFLQRRDLLPAGSDRTAVRPRRRAVRRFGRGRWLVRTAAALLPLLFGAAYLAGRASSGTGDLPRRARVERERPATVPAAIAREPLSTRFAVMTHEVGADESVASIAEHYYGTAAVASSIVRFNGRSNALLRPGENIELPYCEVHRVAPGDSWSTLAARYVGRRSAHPAIALLNGRAPNEPLHVGEQIIIPVAVPYRLSAGDSWAGLAQRFYGSVDLAPAIEVFNEIDDPDRLPVGQTIEIPLTSLRLRGEPSLPVPAPDVLGPIDAAAASETCGAAPCDAAEVPVEGPPIELAPPGALDPAAN